MRYAKWATGAIATVLLLTSGARADSSSEADDLRRPRFDAGASARQGMMLPSVLAADTQQSSRVTGTSWAGYDGARSSFVLRGFVDATIYGRLALRAGVSYLPDSITASAQPHVGARVQLLTQAKSGIDLGVGAFYRMERFTEEEGLIQAVMTGAVHLGKTGLFANLAYGQDAEGDDQEGEVLLAALHSLTHSMQLGLESRARFKLASQDRKARDVPVEKTDISLAPTFSYALGPVAFLAQAGLSTIQTNAWHAGAVAMGGLASSF